MNIDTEMVERAMREIDRRLMRNEWVEACEIARYGIAFEILDAAINGAPRTAPNTIKQQPNAALTIDRPAP